ncbi:MAG: radical SAM protein, partial [Cyanobacteria bacterium]|nr:radical SAM protein [Cyanobacteriota bacterium]
MTNASKPEIIAAYVHIPFCTHKCEFCDFAAFSGLDHLEEQYFEVLEKEILSRVEEIKSRIRLSTIYFGGGTPGLALPARVQRIIETITNSVITEKDAEITLETTPHSITADKLVQWRSMGINRLSIGFESLNQSELTAIGRDHSKDQALQGLHLALEGGFQNISLDFMYGLPTQTLESWQNTLDQVGELTRTHSEITHVSSYGLALADNSPLYSRFPRTSIQYPDDETFRQMYFALVESMTANGFR